MNRNDAIQILENSSYRLTEQRRMGLEAVFRQKGPFSTEDVYNTLKKYRQKSRRQNGGCDLATVYRTLAVFEELQIINRCDFSDEMARYEIACAKHASHHHHFFCIACKSVEHLDFCILEAQEQMLTRLGYTRISHRLEFSGICPKCAD